MEIELSEFQKDEILKTFNLIEDPTSQFNHTVTTIMDHLLNEETIDIWDHDLVDRHDEYRELIINCIKIYLVEKNPPLKCYQCNEEIQDVSLMTHIKGPGFVHSECRKEYEKDMEILLQQIKNGTWY
jgi:hypothetical protein